MDRIIERVTDGVSVKRFPEGFIGDDYQGDETVIPSGKEVSMYRELEGVYVMIDGQRLFFNNPAYAKFIFYCAKAGLTRVKVPDSTLARRAVRGIEEEIEKTIYEISSRIDAMGISRDQKGAVLDEALRSIGAGYYLDVVSRDDQ